MVFYKTPHGTYHHQLLKVYCRTQTPANGLEPPKSLTQVPLKCRRSIESSPLCTQRHPVRGRHSTFIPNSYCSRFCKLHSWHIISTFTLLATVLRQICCSAYLPTYLYCSLCKIELIIIHNNYIIYLSQMLYFFIFKLELKCAFVQIFKQGTGVMGNY